MIFTSPAPPPHGGGYSQSQSDEQNTDPHGYSSVVKTGTFLNQSIFMKKSVTFQWAPVKGRCDWVQIFFLGMMCTLERYRLFDTYYSPLTQLRNSVKLYFAPFCLTAQNYYSKRDFEANQISSIFRIDGLSHNIRYSITLGHKPKTRWFWFIQYKHLLRNWWSLVRDSKPKPSQLLFPSWPDIRSLECGNGWWIGGNYNINLPSDHQHTAQRDKNNNL